MQELCYPSKTFNKFVEEILDKDNKNKNDICNEVKVDSIDYDKYKNACYKSLFYTTYFNSKAQLFLYGRNLNYKFEDKNLEDISFFDFFKFDEPCENMIGYRDGSNYHDQPFRDFGRKIQGYVRNLMNDDTPFSRIVGIIQNQRDPSIEVYDPYG
eukprot:GHVR01157117.1.p2 GENE.GHVR01157117.1~~GHVR01157117.1.p2  ORF type:complete len:155 (+),score=26.08 GHVR01157117.1:1039-1503(+)